MNTAFDSPEDPLQIPIFSEQFAAVTMARLLVRGAHCAPFPT